MNTGNASSSGGAVPTGCYKCGRPGHWSRDCPSDSSTANTNQPLQSDTNTGSRPPLTQKPKQKPPRRTRPKLTPDLLLSDSGIGHILRYFPGAFKFRGRGHELNDLQHLLRLYADWHSRLLPYYNFDQFIQKVEQVGTSKRVKILDVTSLVNMDKQIVKVCLRQLREKVADGIDPTKLQEPQVEKNSIDEPDAPGDLNMETDFQENILPNEDENNFQEDMWRKATEETSQPVHVRDVAADASTAEEVVNQTVESNAGNSIQNQVSEEQIARMEANRLKALERAAARARASLA